MRRSNSMVFALLLSATFAYASCARSPFADAAESASATRFFAHEDSAAQISEALDESRMELQVLQKRLKAKRRTQIAVEWRDATEDVAMDGDGNGRNTASAPASTPGNVPESM